VSFDAAYLNNPPPKYPAGALRQRLEGTTLVRVEVLADGSSGEVVLHQSSGFRPLDEAALDAVEQWRFKPATVFGEPVKQWVNIPVTFRID